jgi:transposase InsO family protein
VQRAFFGNSKCLEEFVTVAQLSGTRKQNLPVSLNRDGGQVWCADITYMAHGFMYLVVVMDWYSRYLLAWRLSNTLDTDFGVEALEEALKKWKSDVFGIDQGSQFRQGFHHAFGKTRNQDYHGW